MGKNALSIVDSSATLSNILIQNSLLYNIMKGVCLNSPHNYFKIENSKVIYDKEKYVGPKCPQLIITDGVVSLAAHFIKSKFKRIFLIDLTTVEQGTSNVSIIGSILDDERINFSRYECSSCMKLKSSTVFIENSNFTNIASTNEFIYLSWSRALLQGCIFRNVRLHLSLLKISANSIALLYNCQFENNSGINRAIIHSFRASALNLIQCVFKSNRAKGYGGVLMSNQTITVNISRCRFIENYAGHAGGAIYHSGHKLLLENTEFTNNSVKMVGAISTSSSSGLNLVHCIFEKNRVDRYGGAISLRQTLSVNISWCIVQENYAGEGSGAVCSWALHFGKNQSVNIFLSSFERNAARFGGAVNFRAGKLDIRNTTFKLNTADHSGSYFHVAQGGAIHADHEAQVKICDSLFKGNMAGWSGGSISQIKGDSLIIKNTLFEIISYSHGHHHFGGDITYSSKKLVMEDVFFKDLAKDNAQTSLLIHTGKLQDIKLNGIHVTCSPGKDILATLPDQSYQDQDVFLIISCSSCSLGTYSVSSGKLGPNLINQTHINCYKCPFGGNCTNGRIKAAENFWGYPVKMSDSKIRFSACPLGYGCLGSRCSHYNSCGTGRTGTLCGQCKKGLTENILTPDCLSSQQCHHAWFWSIVLTAGIVYVTTFLFLKETILVSKSLCESIQRNAIGGIVNVFQNPINRSPQLEPLTDDICCEPDECEDMHVGLVHVIEFPEAMNNDKSDTVLFPGFVLLPN